MPKISAMLLVGGGGGRRGRRGGRGPAAAPPAVIAWPSAVSRTVYCPGGTAGPAVPAPHRIIPGNPVIPSVRRSQDIRWSPAPRGSGGATPKRPPPPPPP